MRKQTRNYSMQRFQSCSALDVSNHSVESLEKHKKPQSAIWTYGTTTGGYQSDEELAWEDVFFPKKNIEEAPEEEEPTSSKTQDSSSKTQDSISDLSPQTIDSSGSNGNCEPIGPHCHGIARLIIFHLAINVISQPIPMGSIVVNHPDVPRKIAIAVVSKGSNGNCQPIGRHCQLMCQRRPQPSRIACSRFPPLGSFA